MTNQWNNLPSSVIEALSTNAKSRRLDKYLNNHELIGNYSGRNLL